MPVYTFRCDAGHEWDEVRSLSEDSSRSADPCQTCLETADARGLDVGEDLSDFAGRRVPSQVSVRFNGRGFTPTFYPNRENKK